MNWLKRIGQAALAGVNIIPVFGPIAAALIPGDKDDKILATIQGSLIDIQQIILNAEVFGAALTLTGEQKLKGAIPAVAQVILHSSIMAGKPPANQALFLEGVQDMTNAMVKILNSRGD